MFPKLPTEIELEIYKFIYADVIHHITLLGEYTDYWLYNVISLRKIDIKELQIHSIA